MEVDIIIIYDNRLIILNHEKDGYGRLVTYHILGYTNLPTGHTLAHGMSLTYFHVLTSTTPQNEAFPQSFTVRKMGLILRSIKRMLKMQFSMARKFTLQPLRRYDVKPPEKTAQA